MKCDQQIYNYYIAHRKSVQFVAPCYCSPVAKVLVSSRVILAEQVNKCLWVHIEVVVIVTVPSEWSRVKGEGRERRERERERERESVQC